MSIVSQPSTRARSCPLCSEHVDCSERTPSKVLAPALIERSYQTQASQLFYLSPAQAVRLLRAAAPHLRPLLLFMLLSGACDIGEVVYLDWENLDLDGAVVRLEREEGPDELPLHGDVVAELRQHSRRRGAVFRGPDGYPYVKTERPACAIKTGFNSARRRAQLHCVTIRNIRVTSAVWQLASTLHLNPKHRIERLAKSSGWQDSRTLRRFSRIPTRELEVLQLSLQAEGFNG